MRNLIFILTFCLLALGCNKSATNDATTINSGNKSVNLVPNEITPSSVIPPTNGYTCFDWGNATRIEGVNTSQNTSYFMLNGNYALTMHIDTWEYGVGIRKAHGYITSFTGPITYTVTDNPIVPTSKVDIVYEICKQPYNGTTCVSVCCSTETCTFTAYLFRDGYNGDGSPKLYLYKEPQTIGGGVEDPV